MNEQEKADFQELLRRATVAGAAAKEDARIGGFRHTCNTGMATFYEIVGCKECKVVHAQTMRKIKNHRGPWSRKAGLNELRSKR